MHALQILQRPSGHATPALCHPIPPNPSAVLLPQVIVVAACNSFLPRRLNYSETGENESNFTSFDTDFLGSCHGAIRHDSALFSYRIIDYSGLGRPSCSLLAERMTFPSGVSLARSSKKL